VTSPPSVQVVEYRNRPMPVIDWPAFPDPTGHVKLADGVVSMSAEYWLAVTRYVIEVEAGIDTVEAYRATGKE
jgi:hypothetical protein